MTDGFLTQLDQHRRTSEANLETFCRDLAGLTVTTTTRISQGYANEVYVASTREHRDLVIRIQDRGIVTFADEAWVMDKCRTAGLPVPKVFGVSTLTDSEGSRDVMVLEKVPGRPLAAVLDGLDEDCMATLFGRVGAALRTMHDIRIEQFGPIGAGRSGSWAGYVREILGARRGDAQDAIDTGLTKDEVNSLLDIIERLGVIPCDFPSLCHGDVGTDHLFVDEALQVTGIIDFGMCQGGPGALDIAILTMLHPEIRLESLWSGYALGQDIPATYARDILAFQANVALTYLAHDFRLGNADSRPIVLASLRSIIERWHSTAR